jgi:choline-sulfatase
LAGVPQVAPNDSISLEPWISDPRISKDPGPVFAEYALGSRNAKTMIRLGQWKYTIWAQDIPELYDLESDPDELHNLAGLSEYAARETELRRRLLAFNSIA